MSQDLGFALRVFRSNPGITAVAVLSLALGMGANSVMFSLVDGMYLRPLPVRDPENLVSVGIVSVEGRVSGLGWHPALAIKDAAPAFADVAIQNRRGALLESDGDVELVPLHIVSDNYFPMLAIRPARGRLFRDDLDSALRNEPAVAIADSLWKRRFGADPAIVGRSMRMNNRSYTVVGILPPGFHGLDRGTRVELWVPVSTWKAFGAGGEFESRGTGQFEPIGRLRPGATPAQAQAQLDNLMRRLQQEQPDSFRNRRFTLAADRITWDNRGVQVTALLMTIVALLVLIACANVALLLLAQSERRKRELAIRLAVGASRARLVRQMLVESTALAALGIAAALALAWWLIPLLPALLPPGPAYETLDIRLDLRVVLVTAATCLLTVLLFGMAPAVSAARTDLSAAIKAGGFERPGRLAGRKLLVASQALLAVVLLSAAGLLTRSFLHSQSQRLGFDTDRRLALVSAGMRARGDQITAAAEQAAARLAAVPGVARAAYCRRFALTQSGWAAIRNVVIPGRTDTLRLRFNLVSPDYFDVVGTRLLSGRLFTRADSATSTRVALINRTMAQTYWPGEDPLGRWIRVAGTDTQVAGVVEDGIVHQVHEPPEPFVFLPFAQAPDNDVVFLAETAADPAPLLRTIKRELRAATPSVVVLEANTLKRQLADALYSDWLPAVLAASVGILGMALAAAGLFGVVMHSVNRRLRELGIRMALGADRRRVVTMVVSGGVALAAAGALAGVAAALASGRLIARFLYGVAPHDPLALTASVLVVLLVAAAASLYPAWRASRVSPSSVLRAD